jgi:pimeloyl-ACP methyl ester carboxylesterase
MPHYKIDFRMFIDVNKLAKDNPFKHFMDFDDLLVWQYPVKTLNSVYSRSCKVLWREYDFKAAIVLGDKDELVKVKYEQEIIERMKHPFDLMVIPEGRHMLPFDHIKDLIHVSRDFFNRSFNR